MAWSELPDALLRLKSLGIDFGTIIDVGASDGQWTRAARAVYPQSAFALIEALDVHQAALTDYAASASEVEPIFLAAADHDGEVYFEATEDIFGGRATNELNEKRVAVRCARLDTLAKERAWKPPYLIKLDTHGFEIPILRGASGIMESTAAAIIEAYNFPLGGESVRFHELCLFMEEQGFRCFDVFDLLRREKDNALWQFDMVFLRLDFPTMKSAGFN